jgi:hypothetical protein
MYSKNLIINKTDLKWGLIETKLLVKGHQRPSNPLNKNDLDPVCLLESIFLSKSEFRESRLFFDVW